MRILAVLFLPILIYATTMQDLFEALRQNPSTRLDDTTLQKAKISQQKIEAEYFPKINLFGGATLYNVPTNLRPYDPLAASKNTGAVPFGKDIEKFGINFSMPLFAAELAAYSKKASLLHDAAAVKNKISLLQNQAIILVANAKLRYLEGLMQSLVSIDHSLQTSRDILQVAVDNGRAKGVNLDALIQKQNGISIALNEIEIKKQDIIAQIEDLTAIKIKTSLPISIKSAYQKESFLSLIALQKNLEASQQEIDAKYATRYYPKVSLQAMWSKNYTQNDVKFDDPTDEDYNFAGINILVPLFDKSSSSDLELARVELNKNKIQFEKTKNELEVLARTLENKLTLLEKSVVLNQDNLIKSNELLDAAKVAFLGGRMSVEDYLPYEDRVLESKAKIEDSIAAKWELIAKLAIIYGNNLKDIIK